MFSYNNAGYCVLGRLVEVLRGLPYDECLRIYLIRPLRLTHTAPGPHEAIMYRAAQGHIQPDGRCAAPAGSDLGVTPVGLAGRCPVGDAPA